MFIALAPAVYAGTLTNGFPFFLLKSMDWATWRRFFGKIIVTIDIYVKYAYIFLFLIKGVLDYIPLMRKAYDYVPGKPFALLGYQV